MLPGVLAYLSSPAFPGVLAPGSEEGAGSQAPSLAELPADAPSAHAVHRHPLCCLGVPAVRLHSPLWQSDRSCKNSCLTFPAAFKNRTTNKEVEWMQKVPLFSCGWKRFYLESIYFPLSFLWSLIIYLPNHSPHPLPHLFPSTLSFLLPSYFLSFLPLKKNLPSSVSVSFFNLNFLLSKGNL